MDDTVGTEKRDGKDDRGRIPGGELGELLKLFTALGFTVAVGIVGFFLLGLWADRKLSGMGWQAHGVPRILITLFGIGLSIYWAYLRIARHLDKFELPRDDDAAERGGEPE